MWEGGMRQKDMKLVCVEGVLEALGDLGVEQDLEREFDQRMAKLMVNNLDIRYLVCKESQVSALHLLNIEAVEVYPQIYKVRRVLDPKYSNIRKDDLVVKPPFFLPEEINGKQFRQDISLNIVRIKNADVHMFKMDIRLELNNVEDRELVKCIRDRDMTYIKVFDFYEDAHSDKNIWQDNGRGVVLDLRNNKGGKLTDMRKVFGKIFKSYQLTGMAHPAEKVIDFAVKGEENAPYPKAAIIMNSCTASSAEIFIRLCKFYFGAVLIGTETYGKNVICKNIQINGFSFNMPQYRYRIAGVEAEDGGIAPDICLQDTEKSNWEDIMSQCDVMWKGCLYAKI